MVLLLPDASEVLTLGADAASALAALGVSSAALVRGGSTVGIVLEGWAFDSSRAGEAAAVVGAGSAIALTALVQMAVSAAATEGDHDEEEARAAADDAPAHAR